MVPSCTLQTFTAAAVCSPGVPRTAPPLERALRGEAHEAPLRQRSPPGAVRFDLLPGGWIPASWQLPPAPLTSTWYLRLQVHAGDQGGRGASCAQVRTKIDMVRTRAGAVIAARVGAPKLPCHLSVRLPGCTPGCAFAGPVVGPIWHAE
jgi:hypothetical protein